MRRVNKALEAVLSKSVILLCAAASRSSRVGGFASPDEPLDEGGRRDAAAAGIEARFHGSVLISPARAARETADAMGLKAREEPALSDMDHGTWSGRSFAQVHEDAPEALAAWLADPLAGAPGGERMAAVMARVAPWLDGLPASAAPLCAITHPMTIRCMLAHALDLPLRSTLAIDIAPLSRVRLSFNARWRLQALESARFS